MSDFDNSVCKAAGHAWRPVRRTQRVGRARVRWRGRECERCGRFQCKLTVVGHDRATDLRLRAICDQLAGKAEATGGSLTWWSGERDGTG